MLNDRHLHLGNDWQPLIDEEKKKNYFQKIRKTLSAQKNSIIYPTPDQILYALRCTPCAKTKVVILGQDPYHGPNQAHGLAFSVQKHCKIPPSLSNIFKAIQYDLGTDIPAHGDLTRWAQQGVLLLNTTLTVTQGNANAHQNIGWHQLTDAILKHLNHQSRPLHFLLWGRHAQQKQSLITQPQHSVLTAPHPSPLSAYRGFIKCKHFSCVNQRLIAQQQTPIDW